MKINLVGNSVSQESSETKDLDFKTVVRKATVQTVEITNTDDKEWAINPTISTQSDSARGYFTGKQTLVVPAKGKASFEVNYLPKSMTGKQKKADSEEMEDVPHTRSLFFPLPNGSAILYQLKGLSTEPEIEDTIEKTVTARNTENIVIPVKNWSR